MRYFAIAVVAVSCVVACEAYSRNIDEIVECQSYQLGLVLRGSFHQMSVWVNQNDPEKRGLARAVMAKLGRVRRDFEKNLRKGIKKKVSRIAEEQTTMREAEEVLNGRFRAESDSVSLVTIAAIRSHEVLRDYSEAFGPEGLEVMKGLQRTLFFNTLDLHLAVHDCF